MQKYIIGLLTVLLSINYNFSQIPVKEYHTEIEMLENDSQISDYWNSLYKIDQDVLLQTTDLKTADSISISNMIKTTLIFDIHKTKGYNPNGFSGFLPIINLSHNQIGQSQIAYWPVIEQCAEIGGAIESFGGKYPAYQLESVSLTFYNYSLTNQEQKYPKLLRKMSELKPEHIIDELLNALNYENQLRELHETKVLHQWYLQAFKNRKEEGKFSLVRMSDDNLYLKRHGRLQKLVLVESKEKRIIYRIENEPFGWTYSYGKDGSLYLVDDNENELIQYTLVQ